MKQHNITACSKFFEFEDDPLFSNIPESEIDVSLVEPDGLNALLADMDRDQVLGKAVERYTRCRSLMLARVKENFGLSEETYKEMSLRQGGKCYHCSFIPGGSVGRASDVVWAINFLWPDPAAPKQRLVCYDCFCGNEASRRHCLRKEKV